MRFLARSFVSRCDRQIKRIKHYFFLLQYLQENGLPQSYRLLRDSISRKLPPRLNSPWKCSGSVDKKLGEVQEEGGADGRGVGGRDGHQGGRRLNVGCYHHLVPLSPPGGRSDAVRHTVHWHFLFISRGSKIFGFWYVSILFLELGNGDEEQNITLLSNIVV